ncbi:MAG TPA: hypothetical protein VGN56_02720 [Candidatus Paceibacterota bacterium]|jgi:phage-related holin|nr:hypothetical protein [Candidatus Paceibacterota bacterium]
MAEEGTDLEERLDQLEELVEEQHKLTKDTNRIVRDMRRTGRIAFWFKVIIWIIVLGVPLFFLGPILQYFTSLTGVSIPTNASAFGVPSADQIQKALSQYKSKSTASP